MRGSTSPRSPINRLPGSSLCTPVKNGARRRDIIEHHKIADGNQIEPIQKSTSSERLERGGHNERAVMRCPAQWFDAHPVARSKRELVRRSQITNANMPFRFFHDTRRPSNDILQE